MWTVLDPRDQIASKHPLSLNQRANRTRRNALPVLKKRRISAILFHGSVSTNCKSSVR